MPDVPLSGSTGGSPIPVTGADAPSATLIHASQLGDELHLYVANRDSNQQLVTLMWSDDAEGSRAPILVSPHQGWTHVQPFPYRCMFAGQTLKAFADAPGVVSISGFVRRV